jgi:chorismate mutase
MADDVVRELREQISAVDRGIVDALNRRLELVGELWEHKRAHDLPVVAPDREAQLLDHLASENHGPLSSDGLRAIYTEILALTKRELGT